MANHKSAEKRIRQSARARAHNRHIRSGMRTSIKQFRQAAEGDDRADAAEKLRAAERSIRKAATKGIIPKRRASRIVSRLAKSLPGG